MADRDAELVARLIASRDHWAFEQLVRQHQSPVRNFFRRLTHADHARADDLAQETFLKVFRSITSFQGQAKFSTWLYRVAYNVFLDEQRRRASPSPSVDAFPDDITDAARRLEEETEMDRMLRHLPLRQRAVFDLHFRKDLSHPEIAIVLDIPLGTVKSDLSRGLEQLRLIVASGVSNG